MKHLQAHELRATAQRFRPIHVLAQQNAIDEIMPAQTLLLVHENECLFSCRERWLTDARQESVEFILVETIIAIGIYWH